MSQMLVSKVYTSARNKSKYGSVNSRAGRRSAGRFNSVSTIGGTPIATATQAMRVVGDEVGCPVGRRVG